MASEVQFSFRTGGTTYVLVRNGVGQIWQTTTSTFVAYATLNFANYTISATEQGTASSFYTATFPAAAVAGTYGVTAKQQIGGTAAETDPTIAVGNLEWNGTAIAPLSDAATSGLVGQFLPMRLYRGQMIKNFPFKLVSSSDHITSLVSGQVSGQISRDGGSFGALQSGAFTEIGLGWYSLQSLTSGDLLANTIALVLTGTGVSGGTADQRDFGFILQRVSGFA